MAHVGAVSLIWTNAAVAQGYSTKPIKMMVLGLVSATVLAHGSQKSRQTICAQPAKCSPDLTE
jgi:hypothetical protein